MRFGTIGTGYIVRAFLDGVYKNGGTLEAVYSRTEQTAAAFAKDYGTPKIYTSLEEMYQDDKIDVIYIASPNSLHYPQTLQALRNHKNVVVEKPMCSNTKECQTLIDEAKKRGLFLFEAITNQHLPNYRYIREILPAIGRIRMVQCNYSQYSSRYDAFLEGKLPNVFNPAFSGGALYDINIYNIHFVTGLFGKPQEVCYYANIHENGIDVSGTVILRYPDFLCQCVGAKDSASLNHAQIQGEKGYIYVHQGGNGCRKVELHVKDQVTVYDEQPDKNLLYYENVDFKEIIENKDYAKRDAYLEESLAVMEILTQARSFAKITFAADQNA